MESEILNEQIDREARRFAACFGLPKWEYQGISERDGVALHCYGSYVGESARRLTWEIREDGTLDSLNLQNECDLWREANGRCKFFNCPSRYNHQKLLARAFYCLGIEDESILSQLNDHLSAQEKLELQLGAEERHKLRRSTHEKFERYLNVHEQLNHPLNAREKLKLRFNLPREFWPQNWLNEAAE